VVDHDRGVGQADTDGGPVAGGHVDRDVADLLPPGERSGGEPGQDVGGGTALDLAEQPLAARGIDEAGVPAVRGGLPPAGVRILPPLHPAAAGLVDPQDRDRFQGRLRHLASCGAEGVHHGWPGQPQVTPGLDDRGSGVTHPPSGCLPQPGGDPCPRRDLAHVLGEALAWAGGLGAVPAALVPHQLQLPFAEGQIAGAGDRVALHACGEHAA
jgi:hypothetical protein